jgi:hypothetical protein
VPLLPEPGDPASPTTTSKTCPPVTAKVPVVNPPPPPTAANLDPPAPHAFKVSAETPLGTVN